jgi:L-seryl-tRNA(Ser) seleniumtransferase
MQVPCAVRSERTQRARSLTGRTDGSRIFQPNRGSRWDLVVSAVFKTVGRRECGGRFDSCLFRFFLMNAYSRLPQIERLLQDPLIAAWCDRVSRPLVVGVATEAVADARTSIKSSGVAADRTQIVDDIISRCNSLYNRRLRKVINATGIVIHTNMGRAPIAPGVWAAAEDANTGYTNLEISLTSGKRERRGGILPDLLAALVGCDSATVVNNCAAALYLSLTALCAGREVIVSRGEQVQIGGGFRIPDILKLSGAKLIEVGTTNITTVDDYVSAITPDTAMVLLVHSSNFHISGFASSPTVDQFAGMLPDQVVLAVDQGSGITTESIPDEKRAGQYLADGAHLVSFSGDKVLGGPQAGFIVGRRDLIETLEGHPLMRVLRTGKTIRSLIEEHLVRKLNGTGPGMAECAMAVPVEELEKRGTAIISESSMRGIELSESEAAIGGGSAPGQVFPSVSLVLPANTSADTVLRELRSWRTPIIGTISRDRVFLNLSTILESELTEVAAALQALSTKK